MIKYKTRKEFDAKMELIERNVTLMNNECKQWLNEHPRKRKVPSNVVGNFNCVSYRTAIETGERIGWERMYYHFSDYFFDTCGKHLYNTI